MPATADDDCFWLYSSGSTGAPKGAVRRHRDMAVTSQRFGVETLGIREDDVFYSEAKLFFAYGLGQQSHLSAVGRRYRGAERQARAPPAASFP